MKRGTISAIFVSFLLCYTFQINAQEVDLTPEVPKSKTVHHDPGFWLGYYTKFRLSEKMFYYGEYHLRMRHGFSQVNKIYLRYGATYLLTKKVELTVGIATPLDFAKFPDRPNTEYVVPEFRFWEQAVFVLPVLRSKTYHQIRLEQRWKRKNDVGAEFKFSYRWRYKFTIYVPLNHHHLQPKTLFFSFYDEIFIQSGKSIVYNHFEDNRMFVGLGYIVGNGLQVQSGYLWNFHHDGSPYIYESQDIWRVALYHQIDFYGRKRSRQPPIRSGDELH
jgi:hypothetical protein